MKYLVLLAVLVGAYLVWRARQRPPASSRPPPSAAPQAAAQDMVRCPVCAVHLPRGDAVADAQGRLFCCPEHRESAQG